MALSNIEWCDYTFNPWIGCTKVSPACDNCYAENYAKRFGIAEWALASHDTAHPNRTGNNLCAGIVKPKENAMTKLKPTHTANNEGL